MSQAPYMPLFVDAYLADTTHLSAEESGAYLHLLMAMWRHDGSLADDDRDLARIARLSLARWKRTKARIAPLLLVREDGRLTQKRLAKEWERVAHLSQANRVNALLRWGKERRKSGDAGDAAAAPAHGASHETSHKAPHNDSQMQSPCPQTQTQTQATKKELLSHFEQFWAIYPRKTAKDAAARAFAAALKRASLAEILAGATRYAASRQGQEARFTAHAATWLNGGRWADEEALVPGDSSRRDLPSRAQAPPHRNGGEMFGGLRIKELGESDG